MEFGQVFGLLAAITVPLLVAWVNAIRQDQRAQADRLQQIERQVLQQRIDVQREMVGRHEIERLSSLITHLTQMIEQVNARVERLSDKLEGIR